MPFRIAFGTVNVWGMPYLIPNQAIDALLMLDMVVKAHTAFQDERSILVYDLPRIRQHYFGNQYRFDIIAAAPLDLLVWMARPKSPNFAVMAWLRLPKLLRTYDVYNRASRNAALSHSRGILGMFFSTLFPLLLGSMHLLACSLWIIGAHGYDAGGRAWFDSYRGLGVDNIFHADPTKQYALSMFWVSTVISTTGEQAQALLCA